MTAYATNEDRVRLFVSERLVGTPPALLMHDITGCEGDYYWPNVGSLKTYQKTQRTMLAGGFGLPIFSVQGKENFRADPSPLLNPATIIQAEVLAGRNAVVGKGLTLTRGTAVATGCWLRTEGTVNRTILLSGACVGEGAYRNCRIVELTQVVGSRVQNRDEMLASCPSPPSHKTHPPKDGVCMGQEGDTLPSGWELA